MKDHFSCLNYSFIQKLVQWKPFVNAACDSTCGSAFCDLKAFSPKTCSCTTASGKSCAPLASPFGGKRGYVGRWNRWSISCCCFLLKIPDFCRGWIQVQKEKRGRAHLCTLLLVRTGCPAPLLPDHVTDASGPASRGWLPLAHRLGAAN